jgi:hypothetical protein
MGGHDVSARTAQEEIECPQIEPVVFPVAEE